MFFANIIDVIRKRSDNSLIIGGDFNCALRPREKIGGAAVERKTNVISEITLWRCQHSDQVQVTWRDKALKVQCRLDYWLISKDLSRIALNTGIKNSTLSDHSAITLTLQSEGYAKRGPGFWKFNNSHFLTITPLWNNFMTLYASSKRNTIISLTKVYTGI